MTASITRILPGMLCLFLITGLTIARAQQSPPANLPLDYTPLVTAGQLTQSSKPLAAAAEPGATLSQKHVAVTDRPVVQALDMLRRWLDAPDTLAEERNPDGTANRQILYSVLALQKALTVRNYVFMADGCMREAIDAVRDALRLSYAVGSCGMTCWLSGVSIETAMVNTLLAHRDQFSVVDSERLLRLAQDWTEGLDPLPAALEKARRDKLALIREALSPEKAAQTFQELSEENEGPPVVFDTEQMTPRALQHAMAQVVTAVDAAYANAQLALRTPYWERTQLSKRIPRVMQPDDPVAHKIVHLTMPDLDRTTGRYTQVQAIARLMGCHAAIRRYRWEHDSLPPSLEQLKIGDMAVDPFTGKPFLYKADGKGYTLDCAAPNEYKITE